jgi:uncharacterized protein (DUF2141 family)
MRRVNPVVLLLTLMCLAGGILLYFDNGGTSDTSRVLESLEAIAPPPKYIVPESDQLSLHASVTETSFATNSEADSSDAVAGESTQTLSIHISGLKNQSSMLYVAVFDSAKGFPKPERSRTTTTIPVTGVKVDFSLSLPDMSKASIAIFQDLNGDGTLTKNSFGLPIEPYGFSNNARSTFGPPSFSQAAFRVSEETPSMEIRVH